MIAFDAFSSGSVLPGSSITFSHTCTGSNRILIVGISSNNADVITGVTYAGISLTLGKKNSVTSPTMYMWYLLTPATGANNVVVSASSGGEYLRAVSASYTGVKQSGQPDATAEQNITATAITTTLTQFVASAWQVGIAANGGTGVMTASTGTTSRGSLGGITFIGDSNGNRTAGTQTLVWANDTSTQLNALQLSIADVDQPAATAGTITASEI